MKVKHLFTLSVLMLGSLSAAKNAAVDNKKLADPAKKEAILHKLKVKKLEIELEKTPEFQFSGANSKKANNPNNKWLEIEILVDIDTKSDLDFLPTMEATFTIVYKTKKKGNKKVNFEKIERTVTYKNVNIEEGKVYLAAYIDPDTLRMITDEKRPAIHHLTGIAVSVNTKNLSTKNKDDLHKYELFDRKLGIKKDQKWWKSTNINPSTQQLLAHSETPFANARKDRYPNVQKKDKSTN